MTAIESRSPVKLGVVPTHFKFVGCLLPDEHGRMIRDDDGQIAVVSRMKPIMEASRAKIEVVQISLFPGVVDSDIDEMVNGLRELGLEVHFILMSGGEFDPMNPADENGVVDSFLPSLAATARLGIETVCSTSIENWMQPAATRKEGKEFEAAIDQNIAVHLRLIKEAKIEESSIKSWHIEFLRDVEFQTFTDLGRVWQFVQKANLAAGHRFFKTMVDAAHCGDSRLSIPENIDLISQIGEADGLGTFHASAKTTRGCLSTDDGWIGALLTACVATGKLEYAIGELFHHDDPGLEALRNAVPGHGIDTTDGRTYDQTLIDGMETLARRLNNLAARSVGRI
jgi:hypothetical protein